MSSVAPILCHPRLLKQNTLEKIRKLGTPHKNTLEKYPPYKNTLWKRQPNQFSR